MVSLPGFMRVEKLAEAINREKYFLLREKQEAYLDKKARSLDDFLEKWTGALKGVDPDAAKFEYLREKYK